VRSRALPRILCFLLLALGAAVAGYLLHRIFLLQEGRPQGGIDICSAVFGKGCDATLSSATWFLWVPLPGWALIYYTVLGLLLGTGGLVGRSLWPQALVLARALTLVTGAVSVVLLGLLVGGWVPLCPLCLIANTVNLVLVWAVWRLGGADAAERRLTVREGRRLLFDRNAPDAARDALALVLPLFAALLVYQWAFLQVELRRRGTRFNPGLVVASFAKEPRVDIPVSPEDPRLGPPDAAVTAVVFSDLQCPGCRSLARILQPMVGYFAPDFTIVFKNFPLGKDCNPSHPGDTHPYACAAAWAATAAARQGKFWEFEAALIGGELQGDEDIVRAAETAGLDMDRFAADRENPDVREKVAEDVALGHALGVQGTPTVYLDGRIVPLLSRETLLTLIAFEKDAGSR